MLNEKKTTQLRLPGPLAEYIERKAAELGVSQNGFTVVLLDLGRKFYESSFPEVSPPSVD